MSEQSAAPAAESQAPSESQTSSEQSQSQSSAPAAVPETAQAKIAEAIENGASKKEVQSMIKKFNLKVDGNEYERSIDLGDENALRNELQLAAVARQRMAETANLKKLYQQNVDRLAKDPFAVLAEMGLDPDQLAEMRIQQRIEEMKKSPEQIEREKIQKELETERQRRQQLEAERQEVEFAKLKEQASAQIEDQINKALDAHKTLPKSRTTVRRIADTMLWAMDQGYQDVGVEDVLPLVERDIEEEMNKFVNDMPEELFEKYFGKRLNTKRQEQQMKALKAQTLSQVKPTTQSITQPKEEPKNKINSRDFFKKLGK